MSVRRPFYSRSSGIWERIRLLFFAHQPNPLKPGSHSRLLSGSQNFHFFLAADRIANILGIT